TSPYRAVGCACRGIPKRLASTTFSSLNTRRVAVAETPCDVRAPFRSVNLEIVSGDNLAAIGLMNLFQQLLFTPCLSALFCGRLVAARVRPMVEDQQPRFCFAGNGGKLFR